MHSDEPGTDTLQLYRIKRGSASIEALLFLMKTYHNMLAFFLFGRVDDG